MKVANVSYGMAYLQFKPQHEELLKRTLQYELANSHWIKRHTNWDGIVRLYNEKYRSFPVGLIKRVEAIEGKITLNFLDKIVKICVPGTDIFTLHGYQPRQYQLDAINRAVEEGMGIINIATGGGKTLIGCELIRRFAVRSIVFVPTKTLLWQWHRELSKLFNVEIGVVGDGNKKVRDITVCSVQSAERDLVKNFNLAIFDETHRLGAKEWRKVSRMCNARYRFGLSATALLREDNANLEIVGICGELIQLTKAKDLQEKGYLADCTIEFVPIKAKSYYVNYQQAYQEQIVRNTFRNEIVLRKIEELVAENRKVLVLVDRIEHGRILATKGGYKFLSGQEKGEERMKAIKMLENGEINVLITTKIFELGVDIPIISGLVVASPAASIIKIIQRIGRGLRKAKGKKDLRVIDFFDNARYFRRQSLKRYRVYLNEGFRIEGSMKDSMFKGDSNGF
ncbi:MAG: DEAD/DEAH box helicase [Candidatus Heimdallarchaeaceae archaeon]